MHAEDAYLFRHALMRDVAYELQLPMTRARLHGLAFELIEELAGGRPEQDGPQPADALAGELADHAKLAGDEALLEPRRLYSRRAAAHAEKLYLNEEAARRWQDAAALETGPAAGRLLRSAGLALARAGRAAAAEACVHHALALLTDPREAALCRSDLGNLWRQTGRVREAEQVLREALSVLHRAGAGDGEARVSVNLAALFMVSGRNTEAEALLTEVLPLLKAAADQAPYCGTLVNLATLQYQVGRTAESERNFELALPVARANGLRSTEGVLLANLCSLYRDTGRHEQAESLAQQGLRLLREVGDRVSEGITLGALATLYQQTGRGQECVRISEQAIAIHREVGNRRSEAIVLMNLGSMRKDEGAYTLAETAFDASLAILATLSDPYNEATALGNLADVYRATGRLQAARELFQRALAMHEHTGNRHVQGIHHCDFARALIELGCPGQARQHWQAGVAMLQAHGYAATIAELRPGMLAACARAGVPELE